MDLPQIDPEWIARRDIRREYREERELEVFPLLEDRRLAQSSAMDLAIALLKTTMILNGGALLGIPAAVNLFNIDAEMSWARLALPAGLFLAGIGATLLAWICAFFSQARLADNFQYAASAARATLDHTFQRLSKKDTSETMTKMAAQIEWHHRSFLRHRRTAIVALILATALFAGGACTGGYAVATAPHKSPPLHNPSVAS